jgi:hypothetical protein
MIDELPSDSSNVVGSSAPQQNISILRKNGEHDTTIVR